MTLTKSGLKQEISRRKASVAATASIIILEETFPEQNSFILDPSRYLAACCTRRAGKSTALALKFLLTMEKHPKSQSLYLALTQESAKQIMWGVLQDLDEKYRLNLKFTESALTVSHPNGAKLRLMGADLSNYPRRLRGRKFAGVAIDEGQDFSSHIQSLINDVLIPSIIDYADGWIAITGTPGAVPQGLFFDITQNNKYGYSVHKWSILDNPFVPDPAGFIADLQQKQEWADDNPTLLREYRGQWVIDSNALWVRYNATLSDYQTLPKEHKWNYVLGVDIGFKDADAIVALAWSETCRETYLIEEDVAPKQTISQLVTKIDAMQKKYNAYKIVMDEGGLGKKIAEDIRLRFGCPLVAADKAHKQDNVEFLNDDLRLGRFKAKKTTRFVEDSYLVQIDWAKSTPKRIQLKKDPHSDVIDAVLYAYRESYSFTHSKELNKPKWGTKEWADAEVDEMFNRELEGYQKEQEYSKWENGGE